MLCWDTGWGFWGWGFEGWLWRFGISCRFGVCGWSFLDLVEKGVGGFSGFGLVLDLN
jgi:hypothetical protein